jgi:hypothetical protein
VRLTSRVNRVSYLWQLKYSDFLHATFSMDSSRKARCVQQTLREVKQGHVCKAGEPESGRSPVAMHPHEVSVPS